MTSEDGRRPESPEAAGPSDASLFGLRLLRAPAFGSGAHETTSSCLAMFESHPPPPGAHVLDWGAGTGILALAALRLGAGRAIALDIEADATRACRSNAAINGLSGRMMVVRGSIDCVRERSAFGLVTANIHGDLILAGGRALAGHVAPGGTLIVSGLRFEEDFSARKLFEGLGLTALRRVFLSEYVTQVWKRERKD